MIKKWENKVGKVGDGLREEMRGETDRSRNVGVMMVCKKYGGTF